MAKVFVSDAIHAERLVFGAPHTDPSPTTPRWKALSRLYQASLAATQHQVEPVIRPEIYQTAQAHRLVGVAAGDWHLVVKPPEHIRPFHGIPNVFVCDWPFPELSNSSHAASPFFDQVRLLNTATAVACCTAFTTLALQRAGITRAVTLPPVIPGGAPPATAAGQDAFLAVVDFPHQLAPLLDGFAKACAQREGLHLTVCGHGNADPAGHPELAGRLTFAPESASLDGLLADAGFLLCTSSAAGLSLPVAHAMRAGVPVVAGLHSGLASVLSAGSAIPLATHHAAARAEDTPLARHMHLTCHPATADSIATAVLAAAAMDRDARSMMAQAAQRDAERHFGLEAFQRGLARLDGLLAAPLP